MCQAGKLDKNFSISRTQKWAWNGAEFGVPHAFSDNKLNLGHSDEQWSHSVGNIHIKIMRAFNNQSVCLPFQTPQPSLCALTAKMLVFRSDRSPNFADNMNLG